MARERFFAELLWALADLFWAVGNKLDRAFYWLYKLFSEAGHRHIERAAEIEERWER